MACPTCRRCTAYQLQRRAARVNFDWPDIADVFKAGRGSPRGLKAVQRKQRQGIIEELGDLLFPWSMARFMKDPAYALGL